MKDMFSGEMAFRHGEGFENVLLLRSAVYILK